MGDYNGEERRHHRDDEFVQENGDRRMAPHQYEEPAKEETPKESGGFAIGGMTVKTLGAVVSLVAALGGFFWKIEDRYVSKTEYTNALTEVKKDLTISQDALSKSGRRLFIMQYEDELDDLQFKVQQGTATDFERAKIERVKRRIEAIRAGDF